MCVEGKGSDEVRFWADFSVRTSFFDTFFFFRFLVFVRIHFLMVEAKFRVFVSGVCGSRILFFYCLLRNGIDIHECF